MKYTYTRTITEQRCPKCGTVLSRFDDGWITVLFFCLFPIWILLLPFYISYSVLKNKVFKVDIPWVRNSKYKTCTKCGAKIETIARLGYEELNDSNKLMYDNRWWFRIAYFLGAVFIYSVPASFTILFPHPTDQAIATVFICLVPICLFSVLGIAYRWRKLLSVNSKNINTKSETITNELIEYKALLDKGFITQEEFEAKKKQILGL